MKIAMFRYVALLISLGSISLFGGVKEHIKPIEGKQSYSTIPGIDFIYLISREGREEGVKRVKEEFSYYGIYPHEVFVERELSFEVLSSVGLKYTPQWKNFEGTWYPSEDESVSGLLGEGSGKRAVYSLGMSKEQIALALAHLSILQDAWDAGHQVIWILEEDALYVKSPRVIPGLIRELDSLAGSLNWDILFTDKNCRKEGGEEFIATSASARPDMDHKPATLAGPKYNFCRHMTANLSQIGCRYGSYSMVIRRSGMKKILAFAKEKGIFLPYDQELSLVPMIKRYASRTDVVTNLVEVAEETD